MRTGEAGGDEGILFGGGWVGWRMWGRVYVQVGGWVDGGVRGFM